MCLISVIFYAILFSASIIFSAPREDNGTLVKVRIIKQPAGILDGLRLHCYRAGEVYDIPPALATVLVAEGFALIEMRRAQPLDSWRDQDRRAIR